MSSRPSVDSIKVFTRVSVSIAASLLAGSISIGISVESLPVSIVAFDIGLGKLKRQVLPVFLHELELECFLSCVTSDGVQVIPPLL